MINSLPFIFLRSLLFFLLQLLITPLFAVFSLFTFPFPALVRYRIISQWSRVMMFLVKKICGIHYKVVGRENIPSAPCIVLSKHQSAWETLAFQTIFPPQVWVLKKELLLIPFFGWGLALMSPIAINRKSGVKALRQVLAQGKDRLKRGFWIIVFPEGTRMPPKTRGKYRAGGAQLAIHTNTPILPVAHNAGTFWRRKAFLKYPGTIIVSVGKLIYPENLEVSQLGQKVETWIETEMGKIEEPNG